MRQPIGAKLCTVVSTRPSFIMPVQTFGRGATPKKFRGQKHAKFGPIWTTSKFGGEYLRNGWRYSKLDKYWSTAIPPALGETSPVNFGPVTLEISMWNRTHPNGLFRDTIFQPLGGAAPQNFTRARKWPSLTSAPPPGTGVPLTIFFKVGSRIGLKYSVLAVRTFAPTGVASWNFATWCAARWGDNAGTFLGGIAPLKSGRAKSVQNLVRFTTTFEFGCEYLSQKFAFCVY